MICSDFFRLLIAVGCLALFSPRASLMAQVQVNFQLKDAVITLHEPVVLLFKVHNASAQEAVLDLGLDKTEFFHFSLRKPQGSTVQNEPRYMEGLHTLGKVVISAGGDYEQALMLNQWFQFDSTGQYSLTAQLNTRTDISGTGSVNAEPEYIPFEVKERTPERLQKICADLAEQVKLAPNAQAAQEPAFLLSYVADPIAIPYLKQLLDAHKLVENAAISGLERIGSEDSVNVLISALSSRYGDKSDLARESLKRIKRKSSDPIIKQMILNAGVK